MKKLESLIPEYAEEFNLDPKLVRAVCKVESNLNPWACRYEPAWKYFKDVNIWAKKLVQSQKTEEIQQATSWGSMQVMGSVARELGFAGHLTQLAVPGIGLKYGCMKLSQMVRRHKKLEDAIAAYNAGSPRKTKGGHYVNQTYVDRILRELNR